MKLKYLILMAFLQTSIFANDLQVELLEPFLGIKYRVDGTTDKNENYTTFSDPTKRYKKAGLNCSGFVHTASKQLLGKSFAIDDVTKDTNKNSSKNAPLGEDWDFGRDLILNIASNYSHSFINDEWIDADSTSSDGIRTDDLRGWKELFKRINKDDIYLVVFSKPVSKPPYKVLYYHVGIIIKDNNGNVWLYHSTPIQGVHRVWLNYDEKMTPFQKEFKKNPAYDKRVLVLELEQ